MTKYFLLTIHTQMTRWRNLLVIGSRTISTGYINYSPHVCVVGGGPAGFYAAQQLIKTVRHAHIDIYERLPVPFGLVRYGVAPDHPEVKNVINTFNKTALNPLVRFVGNINIGKDVTFDELRNAYHAVLLTYGAEEDRQLGIPGEELENVVSARQLVGWYNGLPQDRNLIVNLGVDTAAILGQGNVALDVARILLTPVDMLKKTDITEHSLAALMLSRVRRVVLIGRRGPLQVAFTIKELREMVNLPGCITRCNPSDFEGIPQLIPSLPRPRKRLTELLCKTALDSPPSDNSVPRTEFCPVFLRTPKCFLPHESNSKVVGAVELSVNRLEGTEMGSQKAVETEKTDRLDCGLVLRSIGYRSVQADPAIVFDHAKGQVYNINGVVDTGVYSAGWLATGPVGVILSTMTNAFTVAGTMAKDMTLGNVDASVSKPGFEYIQSLLKDRGVQAVSFSGWMRIDEAEKMRGEKVGKPREKIVDISEMLHIAATGS